MNPIEQLKTMHGEAKERLSKHPDYILMRSLETLIDNLEGHGTTWDGEEAPQENETAALIEEEEAVAVETSIDGDLEVEAAPEGGDDSIKDWNQALSGDSAKDLEGELAQDLEIELAGDIEEAEIASDEAVVETPVSNAATA